MRIDPKSPLKDAPKKMPGVKWPIPIDSRLDELVNEANKAGAGTSRQELLAAIVLGARPARTTLREAVVTFRTAPVQRAAIHKQDGDFSKRGRGRPRKAEGQS